MDDDSVVGPVETSSSPDLLKNTASNIARLENVIEHSKGRYKYHAHTNSPSDGSNVRWYFCKLPLSFNELAASIPRTEIVGKGDYFRFGIRDSLAIEASFLQREDDLLSSWWKDYAECSAGPGNTPPTTSTNNQQPHHFYDFEEERVGVPVKGGLYEVDLVNRHCFPVYWNGENRRVLRGHWFAYKVDWLPLREDVSEQLEAAYRSKVWRRRRFQPSGLYAARIDLQGSTLGLHALFTGEDDTWEVWLNVDTSGFISFGGNGIKLRRGYSDANSSKPTQDELRQQKEEQMDDYCSQVPVKQLVFMVHGIGQRLEKSNLVDDVSQYREITASLAERHLSPHQQGTQRVLFIPCQWRKGLKLSGEAAVDKITLDGVRGLRVMLSATVHDVLYYMSPVYCQDIIDSVSNQLNRLYLKFLKRNPNYDGKVSIYGHSLGSVLSYDILCHQQNLSSPFPMDWMYKEHDRNAEPMPDMSSQSSKNGTLTNLDHECPALTNEIEDMVNLVDEKVKNEQHEDGHGEDNSTTVHGVESGLDEMLQTGENSLQVKSKEAHHLVCNSEDLLCQEVDALDLDEGTLLDHDEPDSGLEEMAEEEGEKDTDESKTIKMLMEEIKTLKAKISEIELQNSGNTSGGSCQGTENDEIHASKSTITEKLSSKQEDAPSSYGPCIRYTKLEFKVDTFFAVGSPLGVFLALRNVRIGIGGGKDYWGEDNIIEEMPAVRQMLNIFHPFDPVAYRVEPLVCKDYIDKRPVIIPYHKGGRRLHIGYQEFTADLAIRSQVFVNNFKSVRAKVLTICQSQNADRLDDEEDNEHEKEENSYGPMIMDRLTGNSGRIDHTLQDKTFEHPYLQAIGAHTNYWRDRDTALFILKHLYRDIPEDPDSPVDSSGENSKDEGPSSHRWCDQRENADEELPLTFSDKNMVKKISKKAKKPISG
ncbi:hypothetical protein ACFE04_007641 [Oxalis oulophora]